MPRPEQYQQGTLSFQQTEPTGSPALWHDDVMPAAPVGYGEAEDAPSLTPRDAAKAMIRPYILRGNSLDSLVRGMMGHYGRDYQVQIGGAAEIEGKMTKIKAGQLAVTRVGDTPVFAHFALRDLAEEIRREAAETQPPQRAQDVSPPAPVSRSASSRLESDLWNEYRFEYENRERLDLPAVSLDEFSDMRDFADGMTVSLDIDAPPTPYERTKTE